ncbi:hypothetical protein BLA29_005220 [Euroglyphus maynei]|uniref:Uncharacterized protein n=1 Tax=Euroglyphus maynei TaxID=6958 RepID=A0A1Y3BK92_EURMA|nr:hypothetical protein BLA29_005220 [Euroglyphus maynei]
MTSRKYSRYSSRDDNDGLTTSANRISRYSSLETAGDDDYGLMTTRRRTKLSYLNEDDDDDDDTDRFTSSRKTFRPSLSYDVKSPSITDDMDYRSLSSYMESGSSSSYSDRRRNANTSTMNRSLSRMDSKEVCAFCLVFVFSFPIVFVFSTFHSIHHPSI